MGVFAPQYGPRRGDFIGISKTDKRCVMSSSVKAVAAAVGLLAVTPLAWGAHWCAACRAGSV